jgi:hypothetical protein
MGPAITSPIARMLQRFVWNSWSVFTMLKALFIQGNAYPGLLAHGRDEGETARSVYQPSSLGHPYKGDDRSRQGVCPPLRRDRSYNQAEARDQPEGRDHPPLPWHLLWARWPRCTDRMRSAYLTKPCCRVGTGCPVSPVSLGMHGYHHEEILSRSRANSNGLRSGSRSSMPAPMLSRYSTMVTPG